MTDSMNAGNDRIIWLVDAHDDAVTISDGVVRLRFRKGTAGGLTWASLYHLASEKEFLETLPAAGGVLWRVAFRPPDGDAEQQVEITSDTPAPVNLAHEETAVVLSWRNISLGGEEGVIDVSLRLAPGPQPGLLEWRLAVANRSTHFGVWFSECPCIAGLGSKDDHAEDVVAVPAGWGIRYRDPLARDITYGAEYPSVWAAMQYCCLWNRDRGVYLGAHDPYAMHKSFHFETSEIDGQQTLSYRQRYFMEGMGIPGIDRRMDFPAIVGVYDGDWYDASAIYRSWAQGQAWSAHGSIHGCMDFPARLGQVDVWVNAGGDGPQQTAAQMKRFAEFIGAKCGIHYYHWHQAEFDHELPEYFPAKDGVKEAIREMQQAGITVMPYINARMWDHAIPSWTAAKLFAAKNAAGVTLVEEYGAPLSVMCPTTPFWQETIAGIVRRLFSEFQVDGVYLDQISSAPPTLCFDASHGHGVGGGDFWWQGYRQMLDRLEQVRLETAPEGFFTTESNAESWNDKMWGYLTWVPGEEDMLPMYAVVYGGTVVPFGRSTGHHDYGNGIACWKFAQQFLWGAQPGWMSPNIIDQDAGAAAFLRTLVQLRAVAHLYLLEGRMLRAAAILTALPTIHVPFRSFNLLNKGEYDVPAVETVTWRGADGSIALVFANAAETAVDLTFRLDLQELGLDKRQLTLSTLDPPGMTLLGKRPPAPCLEEPLHLDALTAKILVLCVEPGAPGGTAHKAPLYFLKDQ